MSKFIKSVSLAILFLFPVFFITGCQDKNEIESLGFIVAMGVDTDNNEDFKVSLQVIRKGASTERNQDAEVLVYVSTGKTISGAVANISKQMSKKIKFSNEKCIIVGQRLAERGIQPVLDFSLRRSDIRPIVPILVTKGEAIDIVKTRTKQNSISGYEIDNLVKIQRNLGVAAVSTSLDFEKNKRGKECSRECVNTAGIIMKKTPRDTGSENDLSISGSAVFKNCKLIGYMSEKETRGMNWIKGKVRRGTITIQKDGDTINTNILRAGSYIEAQEEKNEVVIHVKVTEKSNIDEVNKNSGEDMDFNSNPDLVDFLSENQNEAIYDEIISALNVAKNTLGVDIFGFGNVVYEECPKIWNHLKENWNENFSKLRVDVNVDSNITRTGILSKSIN